MSKRFLRCPACGGPVKQTGLTMTLVCEWYETEWDIEELEAEPEGEDASQKDSAEND